MKANKVDSVKNFYSNFKTYCFYKTQVDLYLLVANFEMIYS